MSELFWSELVHGLTPYVPGEQRRGPDIVKLNTNENPYPPSPQVLDALARIDGHALRRYPDPESVELRLALANYKHVDLNAVFVGNGSDEILALAFMAFFKKKPGETAPNVAALQYPRLSYSFYPVYCDLLNIPRRELALNDDFSINLAAFENNGGGIVFPNPNAPTSIAVRLEEIEALLARVPDTLVLVDEAYVDFGADSAVGLIDQFPNLLVSQTFSKSRSLAGMRLGAAFANKNVIDALVSVKNSFNSYPVDAVAQRAGVASLADEAYYRSTLSRVVKTRENTRQALLSRGFRVLNSAANFLFVSPPEQNAAELFAQLNAQGVLVRYWSGERLAQWLRISVGTDEDMNKLLQVIDESAKA